MNEYAKGIMIALGPEEGESLWQPLPSTGYWAFRPQIGETPPRCRRPCRR